MGWELDLFEDGEAVTADGVNTRFTDAQDAVNNLDGNSSRRGTFNRDHAASILGGLYGASSFTLVGDDGLSLYPQSTFGNALDYAGYGNDTGTMTAPITGSPRWTCIGHPSQTGPYGGPLAYFDFSSGFTVSSSLRALILLNVEFYDVAPRTDDMEIALCIQVLRGSPPSWQTLFWTERFVSVTDHYINTANSSEKLEIDASIRTMLTTSNLADLPAVLGNGNLITGVRAMVSLVDPSGSNTLQINRWNMTVLPIRSGVA